MAVELYRSGDFFQFEYFGIWQKVMDLAQLYGWVPVGTAEPQHWEGDETQPGWSGRYDRYLGEWVSAEDAAAMAAALSSALDDLPDHPMPDRVFKSEIEEMDYENQTSITFHIIELNRALNIFELFGGQYKRDLARFIAFCHQGGFHIYSLSSLSNL